eukprot:760006-Hanusia_phi.AAC.7
MARRRKEEKSMQKLVRAAILDSDSDSSSSESLPELATPGTDRQEDDIPSSRPQLDGLEVRSSTEEAALELLRDFCGCWDSLAGELSVLSDVAACVQGLQRRVADLEDQLAQKDRTIMSLQAAREAGEAAAVKLAGEVERCHEILEETEQGLRRAGQETRKAGQALHRLAVEVVELRREVEQKGAEIAAVRQDLEVCEQEAKLMLSLSQWQRRAGWLRARRSRREKDEMLQTLCAMGGLMTDAIAIAKVTE